MNQERLISVIVPVYNAEAYLETCLNSLSWQTFQAYDVWLVDDGSRDGSGKICDRFVEEDNRFHVLHKENGGVSSARNLALEQAQGKWICFVDSDDELAPEYLQELYVSVKDEESTFVIQGFLMVCEGEPAIERSFKDKTYEFESIRNVFDDINLNRCGFPFGKMFNNEIIQKNRIRFHQGIQYGEDKIFLWEYLRYVDRLKTLSGTNYHYCIRRSANSLSCHIYSYESEYKYYQLYYALTRALIERFDLTEKTRKSMNHVIAEILIRRAIGAMYQKKTYKSYAERIRILKTITQEQIGFCQTYYRQCAWFHRATVFLLSKRLYRICDMLNRGLAWGRRLFKVKG